MQWHQVLSCVPYHIKEGIMTRDDLSGSICKDFTLQLTTFDFVQNQNLCAKQIYDKLWDLRNKQRWPRSFLHWNNFLFRVWGKCNKIVTIWTILFTPFANRSAQWSPFQRSENMLPGEMTWNQIGPDLLMHPCIGFVNWYPYFRWGVGVLCSSLWFVHQLILWP